jgi:hypothetical protein
MLSRSVLASCIAVFALSGACDSSKPTAPPQNRDPVINGASVAPSVVPVGDSALMICNASDPDGDAIVFDWYADGRFLLKDAPDGVTRYSSPSDSQVVYYVRAVARLDTARIFCYARDRRGGEAGVLIEFLLRDTTTVIFPVK